MVPNECGFNQSETACGLCARTAWHFPCVLRQGIVNYTNAAFFSSWRHNLPSKLKLRNNQTTVCKMSACVCNNNTVIQQELFSRFLPSMYAGYIGQAAARPR